ncbi:MAG: aldehyde ferredoxin oxidoreductase C-terminal domain-containing protein [Dissulfuribacterales bacterium]
MEVGDTYFGPFICSFPKCILQLWGKDAIETEETLIADLTETRKPKVACIGPAGEKMSCISGISNDLGRMAARSGLGAVMGSNECYERGILTKEDTDGLELTWGNTEAMMLPMEKMIAREGIGDTLADGVKIAAEKIGKNSDRFAMHAGGQELPMHDSRFDPGFAVHYAVEATPGRHTIGSQLYYEMFRLWKKDRSLPGIWLMYRKKSKYNATEKKAIKAAACSKFMNVLNGAGGCAYR